MPSSSIHGFREETRSTLPTQFGATLGMMNRFAGSSNAIHRPLLLQLLRIGQIRLPLLETFVGRRRRGRQQCHGSDDRSGTDPPSLDFHARFLRVWWRVPFAPTPPSVHHVSGVCHTQWCVAGPGRRHASGRGVTLGRRGAKPRCAGGLGRRSLTSVRQVISLTISCSPGCLRFG